MNGQGVKGEPGSKGDKGDSGSSLTTAEQTWLTNSIAHVTQVSTVIQEIHMESDAV